MSSTPRVTLALPSWPYLGPEQLLPSRSRQVCLTCHWFRHHADADSLPLLSCQLHEGLIRHGDHLTHRCPRWTQDLAAQRGWAPEVA
jgi:hypothetical protein